MKQYSRAYREEIMALFDRQDRIDSTCHRSHYSVNRYGKRLDFYDLVRKDSLKNTSNNKANFHK